jgi:hypothetical protein
MLLEWSHKVSEFIVTRFLGCAKEMPLSAAGKIRSRSHLGAACGQLFNAQISTLVEIASYLESIGMPFSYPATESSRRKFGWFVYL